MTQDQRGLQNPRRFYHPRLLTLRINGILPYSKIGACIYFDYEDILKVMDENKRIHGKGNKTSKFYRLG